MKYQDKNDGHKNMKAPWGMQSGGPAKGVTEGHAGLEMPRDAKSGMKSRHSWHGSARPPQTVKENFAGTEMSRNSKMGPYGNGTYRIKSACGYGVTGAEPVSMGREGGRNKRPS